MYSGKLSFELRYLLFFLLDLSAAVSLIQIGDNDFNRNDKVGGPFSPTTVAVAVAVAVYHPI